MDRKNNIFDQLRLLFALFVIITHSYHLTGNGVIEPLALLTNGQLEFSKIGLNGFFVLSGFLIFKSYYSSPSVGNFLWKRFLRIFPGLIVVLFITSFVLGPLLSDYSVIDYFYKSDYGQYFFYNLDLLFSNSYKCIDGLFTQSEYGCNANGSLWTLSYELLFYISFIPLFFFNRKYSIYFLLAALSALAFVRFFYVIPHFKYEIYLFNSAIGIKALSDFGMYFVLGSILAYLRFEKNRYQLATFFISLVGIVLSIYYQLLPYSGPFLFAHFYSITWLYQY